MNRTQIAKIYDEMPENQQNMPREQFIKQAMDALDPTKIAAEANAIAQGRIRKAQIDAALQRGQG